MLAKPERRNPEKEQVWRKRIAAFKASGLTLRDFCEKEGINEHSFHWWKREIQQRDEEAGVGKRATRSKLVDQNAFVPVRLVPSTEKQEKPEGRSIEIVAPNGFRVLVPEGAEVKGLTQILVALQRTC